MRRTPSGPTSAVKENPIVKGKLGCAANRPQLAKAPENDRQPLTGPKENVAMRTLIKAILPLCLLLTFAGAAAAQTPDGSPPSQETVCDGQTGAAYGLR